MGKEQQKMKNTGGVGARERIQNTRPIRLQLPSRQALESFLRERIIGQDEFIRKILVAIYRRLMFGLKTNIMVVGQSGSGKTETIKEIAEVMHLPYTIENATEYTQSGYVGNDIETIVDNLYENAKIHGNLSVLPIISIVVMDEIDKKAEDQSMVRGESVSGVAVQQRLLKFMEGMKLKAIDQQTGAMFQINTEYTIFVCMGAFEGLDDIRKERLNKRTVGFKKEQKSQIIDKTEHAYTEADFIKFGMIKEFIGRFDCIAETKKLTQDDLENIIRNSKISAFREYEQVLANNGVIISYSDAMIKTMAKKAFSLNIGARGIRSVVNYIFENILCDVMDGADHVTNKCNLEDDIVYDNTKYEFVP